MSIIEPVGGHGGMNYYDMSLARGLAENGVAITWYTCDETAEKNESSIEVKRNFIKVYGNKHALIRLVRFVIGLAKSLFHSRSSGSKVVHYHFFGMGPLECLMCMAARLVGCRIVATVHDVENFAANESSIFGKVILNITDRFIVHNLSSREALLRNPGRPELEQRTSVIHHGNYLNDVRRLDAFESRQKLGLPVDGPVVLFFGQIKQVKGLDLLIDAMPQVVASCGNVTFVIAGKVWKDDFSRYEERIDRLGISYHVKAHIKYIPDDEVDLYYSAADVVALPYRKIYQSGVLLMAMSYGLPVVASDLPGMKEVLCDGGGYLFEAGSSRDLARMLTKALIDPAERSRIGEQGLTLMREKYSWSEAAIKTKAVYKELI